MDAPPSSFTGLVQPNMFEPPQPESNSEPEDADCSWSGWRKHTQGKQTDPPDSAQNSCWPFVAQCKIKMNFKNRLKTHEHSSCRGCLPSPVVCLGCVVWYWKFTTALAVIKLEEQNENFWGNYSPNAPHVSCIYCHFTEQHMTVDDNKYWVHTTMLASSIWNIFYKIQCLLLVDTDTQDEYRWQKTTRIQVDTKQNCV